MGGNAGKALEKWGEMGKNVVTQGKLGIHIGRCSRSMVFGLGLGRYPRSLLSTQPSLEGVIPYQKLIDAGI